MNTWTWIGIILLGLGLAAWLGYRIWDKLWWRGMRAEMQEAHEASEHIKRIAARSKDPVADMARELHSSNAFRRAYAAEHLAQIGTREAGEALCVALRDADEFVRQTARKAVTLNQTSTQEFNEAVFDSVAQALHEIDDSWATPEGNRQGEGREDVVKLLPRLNRERAIVELKKPNVLRVNHPDAREIIDALTMARVELDDAVFDWLPVLRPCVAEGRRDVSGRSAMVYAKLLRAAAFKKHPMTAAWIDDLFEHRDQVLESSALEGAAEARAILAGLSLTLVKDLEHRFESTGLEGLSLPEQHFVAVREMHFLTELYGMGDYVVHATPSMTRLAVEGLAVMGEHFMRPKLMRGIELRDRQPLETLDEEGKRSLIEEIDSLPWNEAVKYESPMILAHIYAAANAHDFQDKV